MAYAFAGEVSVSVLITTYKHEKYIGECLDSVVMQQTSFPFEVLVGVDDSGDGTLAICREYELKYPTLIKVIVNDHSNVLTVKGQRVGRYNFLNILSKAKGKYIARCDGDDYWTHPQKLQRQFDFLENNPDFVISHHWHEYAYPDEAGGYILKPAPTEGQGYLPVSEAGARELFENRLRIKTRTIMFRNVLNELPDWFHRIRFGDVALSMILAQHGKFGFMNEPMAVYRMTGKGASTAGIENPLFTFSHFIEWIRIWEYGDIFYKGKYHREAMKTVYSFYQVIFDKYKYSYHVFRMMARYSLRESQYRRALRIRVFTVLLLRFGAGRTRRLFTRSE